MRIKWRGNLPALTRNSSQIILTGGNLRQSLTGEGVGLRRHTLVPRHVNFEAYALSSKRTFPSRGIETVGRRSELARELCCSRASSLPPHCFATKVSSY